MSLKLENYKTLSKYYVQTVKDLFSFSKNLDIIPEQYIFLSSLIEEYIDDNKVSLIENGFEYILPNKEYIQNFDIDNLDNNENIDAFTDIINLVKKGNDKNMKIFFSILENAKKLEKKEKEVIREYLNMVLLILEKLNELI